MKKTPQITASDRIPTLQKLTFASGVMTVNFATALMIYTLWMPVFNIGMGINALLLGIVLMIMRAWDAITDPVMGYVSDNIRTRWGRRRPCMVVGIILTSVFYLFFWKMPERVRDGTSALGAISDMIPFPSSINLTQVDKLAFVYLLICGIVYFTFYTIWSVPYYSMQLELTPNYDERTRLSAWMAFFAKIASLSASWILFIVIFIGALACGDMTALDGKPEFIKNISLQIQPWLADVASPTPGEKPIVTGIRLMCWVIAAAILVFGLLPAIFGKERYYKTRVVKQKKESFWTSMKESAKCGPLWLLIGVDFFLLLGNTSVQSLWAYVNFYYVNDGDLVLGAQIVGIKGTVLTITGIACLPIYTWLGERFEKKTMVMGMLILAISGHLLNYFFITPNYPYLQIVTGVFESAGYSAVLLFLPSMKADVADWDEHITSRRREGSLNAFFSWFIKASLTMAMGLSGFILHISGFNPKLASQPVDVVNNMFHLYLFVPIGIWLISLLCAWFYPLTRAKSAEIRAALEARRGAL